MESGILKPMRVAVVGCGAISDIYLTNMTQRFSNLEVVACCANTFAHAEKKAEQYGIKACTYEEILADSSIELIVNLTPVPAHYEIIHKALSAGKHVYTEKTMTVTCAQAAELMVLAKEKGLYLCSAPDTFLGAALQTARQAIEKGILGEITSCVLYANRDLNLLTSLFSFLRKPGGGICADYGVYFLTAAVALLGSVEKVAALVQNPYPKRQNIASESPEFGTWMDYPNESQVSAVLRFERGITGTFHLNGDSSIADQTGLFIFGTKGILKLPDPNGFGGDVVFLPNPVTEGTGDAQVLPCTFDYGDNSRGIGPSEMAEAIRQGRKARTDCTMAYHVMDIIESIMISSEEERFVTVSSRSEQPVQTGCQSLDCILENEQ